MSIERCQPNGSHLDPRRASKFRSRMGPTGLKSCDCDPSANHDIRGAGKIATALASDRCCKLLSINLYFFVFSHAAQAQAGAGN